MCSTQPSYLQVTNDNFENDPLPHTCEYHVFNTDKDVMILSTIFWDCIFIFIDSYVAIMTPATTTMEMEIHTTNATDYAR